MDNFLGRVGIWQDSARCPSNVCYSKKNCDIDRELRIQSVCNFVIPRVLI